MPARSHPPKLWRRVLLWAAVLAASLVLAALSFFFVGLILGRVLPHARIAFYSFPVGGHTLSDANINWSLLLWAAGWLLVLGRRAMRPAENAKLDDGHEHD